MTEATPILARKGMKGYLPIIQKDVYPQANTFRNALKNEQLDQFLARTDSVGFLGNSKLEAFSLQWGSDTSCTISEMR